MASKIIKNETSKYSIHAFKKFKYLKKKYDFIVVEGIGGIMVPLNKKYNLVDFIKLTTTISNYCVNTKNRNSKSYFFNGSNCVKNYDIPIKGIIFNKMPYKPSIVEKTTPTFIENLTNIPILGIIPYYKNIKFDEHDF